MGKGQIASADKMEKEQGAEQSRDPSIGDWANCNYKITTLTGAHKYSINI
jgi:hypothetical protein